jgi:hypothetical protein
VYTLILACTALARDKTDVLVMKNGDRLTCEVKRLEGGVLEVELDYVDGSLAIDWSKVQRIESKALFIVQLEDGSILSGRVVTLDGAQGAPVKLEIQSEPEVSARTVEPLDVVRMAQTSQNFWQRLSGNITLGALYAKGNNSTQYNLSSAVEYRRTRWGASATYNSNLSSVSGAETATRNQIDLRAHRFLRKERYFYVASLDFLESSVQGIQLQTNLGISLGVFLKNSSRMRVSALAGMGWQKSQYVRSNDPVEFRNTTVGVLGFTVDAFRFKKTRLSLTGSVFPALNESDRTFSKSNAVYYVKLFGKIDWNLSMYGSWDTAPPNGFQGSDYGSSTGLSWSFGNR